MAQPYDMTILTNQSGGFKTVFSAANTLTDGKFGLIILVLLWAVIFMRLKVYSTKSAMYTANFAVMIVGWMLFLLGMISQSVLTILVLLFAIITVIAFVQGD